MALMHRDDDDTRPDDIRPLGMWDDERESPWLYALLYALVALLAWLLPVEVWHTPAGLAGTAMPPVLPLGYRAVLAWRRLMRHAKLRMLAWRLSDLRAGVANAQLHYEFAVKERRRALADLHVALAERDRLMAEIAALTPLQRRPA